MKIAYISHLGRPNYEFTWLSQIDEAEEVRFIDTNFENYPTNDNNKVRLCKVGYRENKLINKLFHSTASVVKYVDFEKHLEDIDCIIVLELFSSLSQQFIKYAKKNKIKSVVLIYELIPNHPIYKLFPWRLFTSFSVRNADHFITVSNMAKDHLIKLGAPGKRISTVYPGIETDRFNRLDTKYNKLPKLIFVGKLENHKGFDFVLSAIKKFSPAYQFTIIGDGSYKTALKTIAENNINVQYLGAVENSKLPTILRENDIFLSPARDTYRFGQRIGSEQFGFSLVEAMASGLVVVTTDCGAIPEIVTDNNLISPQIDLEAFQKNISLILKDPSAILVKGKKNVEIANSRYNISIQANKIFEVINKL
jgi:glycosyltransferase involved in cell wall biosynthesis